MNALELAELRRALMARLHEIVRAAHDGESHNLTERENAIKADPKDELDDSTIDELDGILDELDDREAHEAEPIVAALNRMRDGEYGRCIDCDKEIPFSRLKAIPWAERCAEDQAVVDGATQHPTM